MTKKKSDKDKSNSTSCLTWGAGLGAIVAGVAGAYFLYGAKEGAKRRKKIKSWTLKMKGDVMKRLEDVKEVNEDVYNKVVDEVGAKYEKIKSIDPEEVANLVIEMKRYWKHIQKDIKTTVKKKTPAKKKVATKTKKKTTKKTS